MQKDSKLFDDMARMATNSMGVMFDMKKEVESAVAAKIENMLLGSNFVHRDEFETVRQLAIKACDENEKLQKEVTKLKKASKAAEKSKAVKK